MALEAVKNAGESGHGFGTGIFERNILLVHGDRGAPVGLFDERERARDVDAWLSESELSGWVERHEESFAGQHLVVVVEHHVTLKATAGLGLDDDALDRNVQTLGAPELNELLWVHVCGVHHLARSTHGA